MSEFLLIKSTEEQKEEGVQTPVDTAFIGTFFGANVMLLESKFFC